MSIEKFQKKDELILDQVDKVQRYQWENTGEMGIFQMIPKRELHIDTEYQRTIAQDRILKISSHFRWTLFGAIIVVRRDDGMYFVVDGGTRTRSAWKRSDINNLPCMVYSAESVRQEAQMFVDLSTSPVGMSAFQRYRAQLVAGSKYAVMANDILKKYGYTVSDRGKEQFACGCIHTVQNRIKRNMEALDQTIHILSEICEGEPIRKNPVEALFYLIVSNPGIDFYTEYPYMKMKNAGIESIEIEISRVKMIQQKGGEKISAMGLLNIINSGSGLYRKVNRVQIPA